MNQPTLFQVPSIIKKFETCVDGGMKLTIITQELPPEQGLALMELKGKAGWFVFKDADISRVDVPEEPTPEFKEDESPSQRLRKVLYVYWKHNREQKKLASVFDVFYKWWIEGKIEDIKGFLPDKI